MKLTLEKRLLLSFALTLLILFAEVIGGIISKSLALLSDAGHMLTDVFALGLSMIAVRIGMKPSDRRAIFGYQRIGLLAAVINAVSLIIIALFIFYESYHRFLSPPQIHTSTMLIIAGIGLTGNILIALILGHGHKDLNMKSAWVHDQKLSEVAGLRRTIEEALMAMDIRHIMIQFECAECETNGLYCQIHMEGNGNDDSHQH